MNKVINDRSDFNSEQLMALDVIINTFRELYWQTGTKLGQDRYR